MTTEITIEQNDNTENSIAEIVEEPVTETIEETNEEGEPWQNVLETLTRTLRELSETQSRVLTVIEAMQNRLPENLTGLIESQQMALMEMIRQNMETVRTMLTPPQPPPPEPVIVEPVQENVEDVNPEPKISHEEPARRRRRLI